MGTETSLVIQWLRLETATAEGTVGSLVREPRSCSIGLPPKREDQQDKWRQNRFRVRKLSVKEGRLPGEGDAFEVTFKQKLEDSERLAAKECAPPERHGGFRGPWRESLWFIGRGKREGAIK